MANRKTLDKAFFSVQSALKASLRRFMSNSHDIEDVVQETYLRAVASNTSNSIKNPKAYFFRTSRNIALNQQTRMYRRLETALPEEEVTLLSALMTEPTNEIESEYEQKQQFAEFCLAVSELPIRCRKVFVLRKVYGFSQIEIAKKLGISVSTVETHITKGMQRMRIFMSKQSEYQKDQQSNQTQGRADG